MVKKIIVLAVLILSLILGTIPFAGAAFTAPSVYVNGTEIIFDVRPYVDNNTTFIPVRAICNAMGIDEIYWNNNTKTVSVVAENVVHFTVGESVGYINGNAYPLGAPSSARSGRTMIPLRFFAEAFGAEVKWDSLYNCVDVGKDGVVVPQSCKATEYSKDDLVWLSKIVSAESQGEPIKGQIAVANVVLNRVKSKEYPNTIYGVIFDKNYGVQFQPVANGQIYNTPAKTSVEAAKRAMWGENYIGECMYFLNESLATNFWIVNNKEYYTTISNHSFYM